MFAGELFAGLGVHLNRVDIFLNCTSECPLNNCITSSICQNSLCVLGFEPVNTPCSDGIICNGDEVCNGRGRCASSGPAPFNTSCDNGVWCDGDEICDGQGACVNGQDPCDTNPECNNQCNEAEHDCFADDVGTLCSIGECTGLYFILFILFVHQTD